MVSRVLIPIALPSWEFVNWRRHHGPSLLCAGAEAAGWRPSTRSPMAPTLSGSQCCRLLCQGPPGTAVRAPDQDACWVGSPGLRPRHAPLLTLPDRQAYRGRRGAQWKSLLLAFPEPTYRGSSANSSLAERRPRLQLGGWCTDGDRTVPRKGR